MNSRKLAGNNIQILFIVNVRFKLVVNQHPEGDSGGDHWEISPTLITDSLKGWLITLTSLRK